MQNLDMPFLYYSEDKRYMAIAAKLKTFLDMTTPWCNTSHHAKHFQWTSKNTRPSSFKL